MPAVYADTSSTAQTFLSWLLYDSVVCTILGPEASADSPPSATGASGSQAILFLYLRRPRPWLGHSAASLQAGMSRWQSNSDRVPFTPAWPFFPEQMSKEQED